MTMAKIHPNPLKKCSSSSNTSSTFSEKEVYTLWMKSLVFHGNGCTVFNSRGAVVFRVDNYQKRCSRRVILMDSNGKILFSINRKKMRICGCWEGFEWAENSSAKKACFRVSRNCNTFLSRGISLRVDFAKHGEDGIRYKRCYRIVGLEGKSALKIMDFEDHLVAEAVQKQSAEGVSLGEDVLTLMVEPQADQSLVMALVTVYGLINKKI
ncbi:protein LURP-one-related 11-like [Andrographis paniculata]|uniref:protein LURP-one-related 11-like n=1 Tax=Andrographis paniculata TaxID=175694 RepID=UPI0021E9242F|nr:protein LURP-one-related 11-like [Andrographis paniculata]